MMDKKCDECKHRRKYYMEYPCKECVRNNSRKRVIDYFDKKINTRKQSGRN